MTALVAAELLKVRTTRTAWAFLASALGLALLIVVAGLALGTPSTASASADIFASGAVWGMFVLLLGVVAAAGEHRHGTITPTFLITPRRERAVVAKAVAYVITGAAISLLINVAIALVALPWLAIDGAPLPAVGDVAGAMGLGALYGAIAGPLGVGLGSALRSQVGGIVLVFVEMLVVEPLLLVLRPEVGQYLPQAAAGALLGGPTLGGLGAWQGGATFAAYAVALVALGALVESRRDVV